MTIVAAALLLAACGGSSGGGGGSAAQGTSAETVASNPSDFSDVTRCPESGSWDSYLKAEQPVNPSQYASDKTVWDNLKAAGANDGYIAVYADTTSGCGHFSSDTPPGKVIEIYVIRFKDAASAAADFKVRSGSFHLSDAELQQAQSAGGTVAQGDATGLGPNSTAVSLGIAGFSFYVAFWQKSRFEVAMIAYNVAVADGQAGAQKVNGRIT